MTPSLKPEHQIYADLMDEARRRIHAMRDAIAERHNWVPRLLQEFAYLQLRILCETIAVGCLVAHGDVRAPGVLKLWRPPDIMEKLKELNTDFYPRGVRFKKLPSGGLHLDDYEVPQLTKRDLTKLWEQTGHFLHRGSAKNVIAQHGKVRDVNLNVVI